MGENGVCEVVWHLRGTGTKKAEEHDVGRNQ